MKKSKMNKFITGAFICGSFLISSCGSKGNADPNTILFWHTFGQDISLRVEQKIQQCEEIYKEKTGETINVEFEYNGSYDEILEKISSGFAVGNVPTIAVAYPDHVADYLALESSDKQFVYNLEDFFDDPEIGFGAQEYFNPSLKGEEDFVSSFIEEGQQYLKEGTYSDGGG